MDMKTIQTPPALSSALATALLAVFLSVDADTLLQLGCRLGLEPPKEERESRLLPEELGSHQLIHR